MLYQATLHRQVKIYKNQPFTTGLCDTQAMEHICKAAVIMLKVSDLNYKHYIVTMRKLPSWSNTNPPLHATAKADFNAKTNT